MSHFPPCLIQGFVEMMAPERPLTPSWPAGALAVAVLAKAPAWSPWPEEQRRELAAADGASHEAAKVGGSASSRSQSFTVPPAGATAAGAVTAAAAAAAAAAAPAEAAAAAATGAVAAAPATGALHEEAADVAEVAAPRSGAAPYVLENLTGQLVLAYAGLLEAWKLRSVSRSLRQAVSVAGSALAVVSGQDGAEPCAGGASAGGCGEVFKALDGRGLIGMQLVVQVFGRALTEPAVLDARDCAGRTLLMTAVQRGSLPLVKALLAVKADANARGGNGWTALHFAAVGTSAKMCEALLEHLADVDSPSSDGYSALFYAHCAGGDASIVELLESRGARRCKNFDRRCAGEGS